MYSVWQVGSIAVYFRNNIILAFDLYMIFLCDAETGGLFFVNIQVLVFDRSLIMMNFNK